MSNEPITLQVTMPLEPQPERYDALNWLWGKSVLGEADLAQRVLQQHLNSSPLGRVGVEAVAYESDTLGLGIDCAEVTIPFAITKVQVALQDGVWVWVVDAEAKL
jgi:hypothetical protein